MYCKPCQARCRKVNLQSVVDTNEGRFDLLVPDVVNVRRRDGAESESILHVKEAAKGGAIRLNATGLIRRLEGKIGGHPEIRASSFHIVLQAISTA